MPRIKRWVEELRQPSGVLKRIRHMKVGAVEFTGCDGKGYICIAEQICVRIIPYNKWDAKAKTYVTRYNVTCLRCEGAGCPVEPLKTLRDVSCPNAAAIAAVGLYKQFAA